MAPAATTTWRAAMEALDPVGADGSRRRWPGGRRCRIRDTKVSDSSSARPLARARSSMATGSPLAWMGQPKKAQNPQLLQAGRPS